MNTSVVQVDVDVHGIVLVIALNSVVLWLEVVVVVVGGGGGGGGGGAAR